MIEWPLQALAWLRGPLVNPSLDIVTYGGLSGWEVVQASQRVSMAADVGYKLKTRSESLGNGVSRFYAKLWPQSVAEPSEWNINADVESRDGSVLLVSYNADVTFGNIEITPVSGPLPPTPPSITTQPANQSVTEGQTATFSVMASGSAPLAYQWQRDGVDITGATVASYTTPATTLADTGAVFSCRVSNGAGSVTSDAATLTVTVGTTSSLLSDDFNPATTEANPVWRFYDPYQGVSGASLLTLDGSNALIEIPGGLSHDLWAGNNRAPRLLQPAADEDFAIEAKFESTPVAQYQLQGIIVQQDDDTFLRFSTYHDGSSLRVFVAYIDGGAYHDLSLGGASRQPAVSAGHPCGESMDLSLLR